MGMDILPAEDGGTIISPCSPHGREHTGQDDFGNW